MKNSHRVVWTKGMFLAPQHFQAQDAFFESQLQFRSTASSALNWGLTDMVVDQESLANGIFTIRHCRGILQDGLTFSIPDSDPAPEGRPIAEFFPPTQLDLDVFLTIPEQRERGKNFTAIQDPSEIATASTRYVSETRSVLDEAGGTEEKPLQIGRRNFRIGFGGENLEGSSYIRIAQITRNPSGAYVMKQEFIPPSLSITSSEYLMMLLRREVELLTAKSSSLSMLRRQKGRSLAEFGSADVANFWLLHTANTYLPLLKHFWTMRRVHPEQLFLTMLALAGALSTFSLDEHARNLPDYNHDELGISFTLLDLKIRELLETAIPSKFVLVPLSLTEKSIWTGIVAKEEYFKKTQFFLAVGAQMGIDDIIKQTPKLIKVSPPVEIHRLIRNALPGLGLRHAPVPPPAIPAKLDRQYFSINQSGILWDGIVKGSQVSIFTPDEIVKPELELLIVLE